MAKSKNLIFITTLCFLFLLTGLCFVGCGKNQTTAPQLTTPQVVYGDGTIKWEPVRNAEKYEVKINGLAFTTYNNFYDLPLTETSQDFNVSVKSIGKNNNDSKFCEPLIFNARKITVSMGILLTNFNVLNPFVEISFEEISGISNYIIKINGSNKGTYSSSDNIRFYSSEFKTGENIILAEPDIEKGYDQITPACIHIEKSEPLPNIDNYKLIDGQIRYGHNYEYIYDTSRLANKYTHSIALRNHESGKIDSDGPIIEIYKCRAPAKPTLTISDGKVNLEFPRNENDDFTFKKVEVLSYLDGEVLFTKILNYTDNETTTQEISIDSNILTSTFNIRLTTWREDCLASENTYIFNL